MDEKYKFEFLEFEPTQVIGKDGVSREPQVGTGGSLYVPARLRLKMQEQGIECPNATI